MGATHLAVERKYDVPASAAVPALDGLPCVASVSSPQEIDLQATYFDTADLALAGAGITLLRRTGGRDAGWHLTLPLGEDHHEEVRRPLGRADGVVPDEMRNLVRAFVRDRDIVAQASLANRRQRRRLMDAQGATLAEFCDDEVTARLSRQGEERRWREWELELVSGSPDLIHLLEPYLLAAGATPARDTSRLAKALDDPTVSSWGPPKPDVGSKNLSTGETSVLYLTEQISRLKREDLRLRTGDDEAVHQMRVVARRLRSVLATYRVVFAAGPTNALRSELKWLSEVLSRARDAQVLQDRLTALVEGQQPELVLGPVTQRIQHELGAAFLEGRSQADSALASERYFCLLDLLDCFAEDPPFTNAAKDSARARVPRLVQKDLRRVHRRQVDVDGATDEAAVEPALHEVRKAAKRLRYAAESARPVFGKRAKRLAKRAKRLQQLLGEHQDSVLAREALRDLGARAYLNGENGFTFGRLQALEEIRAGQLRRRYPAQAKRLPNRKLAFWLGR